MTRSFGSSCHGAGRSHEPASGREAVAGRQVMDELARAGSSFEVRRHAASLRKRPAPIKMWRRSSTRRIAQACREQSRASNRSSASKDS